MNLRALTAAAVSILGAVAAFTASANWPVAVLLLVTLGAVAGASALVLRTLREAIAAKQTAEIAHATCTGELRRAQVAIARLHAVLAAVGAMRGHDVPSLEALFSDDYDDSAAAVLSLIAGRPGASPA